jgi:hypothetical protein
MKTLLSILAIVILISGCHKSDSAAPASKNPVDTNHYYWLVKTSNLPIADGSASSESVYEWFNNSPVKFGVKYKIDSLHSIPTSITLYVSLNENYQYPNTFNLVVDGQVICNSVGWIDREWPAPLLQGTQTVYANGNK